jgi:hypothetical protein
MAYQNSGGNLSRIMDRPFPSMHFLQVSMMKDNAADSYKPAAFAFLTLAPGEQSGSGRTYNFQRKITLKYEIREIAGLADTLIQIGHGNEAVLNYTKFTQSQGATKKVTISKAQPKQGDMEPKYFFTVSNGNESHGIPMDRAQCLGYGHDLMYIYKLGIAVEHDYQIKNPYVRPDNSAQGGGQDFSPNGGPGNTQQEFNNVATGQGQQQTYQKVNPFGG